METHSMQSESQQQDEQQQLLIRDLVRSFLPWDNLIDSHTTLIGNSSHQYECIITSAVWNKIRLFKVCKVTLTEQDPLFWVLKNSGREYLKMYVKSKQNGYSISFPSCSSSQNDNIPSAPLSFFLISLCHESNHLTQRGVTEQTYKLKHQNYDENNCFCKTISQDFRSQYWNQPQLSEQSSLQSLNERFPFSLYKIYLQSWQHQPEGFTSHREIKEFKGHIFERVTFQICYQNYKEVAYEKINSYAETVYQIPIIVNQRESLCFMNEEIDQNHKEEKHNNNNLKPQFIILPQREDTNTLEMLEQGQFDQIFTDHNSFIYNWINVFEYPIDGDYLEFCKIEGLQLPLQIGSVLLVERQVTEQLQEGQKASTYCEAGVFIKQNEVICVNKYAEKSKENGIFMKDTLVNFLGKSKKIKEFRFKMCFYTGDELNCKANSSIADADQLKQFNCEQLVFQLASNMNFSSETINSLKRLLPKVGKMVKD